MFISVLMVVPVYDKYTATITYSIPWMNNTQIADVAVDESGKRVKYGFKNATNMYADFTSGTGAAYKYGRTAKNEYECIHMMASWKDTEVPFVPDLKEPGWNEMTKTFIHGQEVRHFRIVQDLLVEANISINYTAVRTKQQDFYCHDVDEGCRPMQWFMISKSNFESHFDNYIIEYSKFGFSVTDDDFKFYDFGGLAKCSEKPVDPNEPVGPTGRTPLTSVFRKFKLDKEIKQGAFTGTAAANMQFIKTARSNPNFTFSMAANHMIDMDLDEIVRHKTGKRTLKQLNKATWDISNGTHLNEPLLEDLPTNLDWRTRGIMSYAKDQVSCGSCWTFSAVGCLEARINLDRVKRNLTAPLVSLSEQYYVDCHWKRKVVGEFQTSMGCEGGDEDDLLHDSVGQHVFATAHEYPYFGQNDWCKSGQKTYGDHKVTEWHRVPTKNVVQLKRALMSGPVAVGTAVPKTFAFYAGGIYNDPACGTEIANITHAVVAVGWGNSEYGPYWIVRNSWSPMWGQDGYIYISMKDNICAITTLASYVKVEYDPTNPPPK